MAAATADRAEKRSRNPRGGRKVDGGITLFYKAKLAGGVPRIIYVQSAYLQNAHVSFLQLEADNWRSFFGKVSEFFIVHRCFKEKKEGQHI